jgi:putative chitinase
MDITKLKGHIPDSVYTQLPNVLEKFKIDTPLKLSHFLSQASHESGGFKVVNENLNYSAKGLMGTFKKYFPTEELAKKYERQPEKIANRVYANRMNNGDEASGDGWKFRGRGYIQLTGKHNYTEFGKSINEDIVATPDKISTTYPLLSAAWFFSKNCLAKCTAPTVEAVTAVTKCVNGGVLGLSDRQKHFEEYYALLK